MFSLSLSEVLPVLGRTRGKAAVPVRAGAGQRPRQAGWGSAGAAG